MTVRWFSVGGCGKLGAGLRSAFLCDQPFNDAFESKRFLMPLNQPDRILNAESMAMVVYVLLQGTSCVVGLIGLTINTILFYKKCHGAKS